MRKLILTRRVNCAEGCFGRIAEDRAAGKGRGLALYSAEPPWRENLRRLSCIPAGVYTCVPYSSPKFPGTFRLASVPGRSDILIHSGNFAGNRELGLRTDSSGCILPGAGVGRIYGQHAVKGSRKAMEAINAWSGRQRFILEIREDWTATSGAGYTGLPDHGSSPPEADLTALL